MIGQTISHYKVLSKLGEGGMGVVYKAQDLKLDRSVALKFLPPELTRDPEAKQRFVREAKAASALQHNNICVVYDIDQTNDGQMFISMEFLEGETLKKKIENGRLKIEECLNIATQIALGLARAHEHGIVHRDIKPANIMVTRDGHVKIVDFGLAKLSGRTMLTRAGSTVGTIAYMSPEQTRGEAIDQRTDIWSLGAVLYEMIAGRSPFKGDFEHAVIYAILNEDPEPLSTCRANVPLELEQIVVKSLEKKPDDRYQNLVDILDDLRAVGKGIEWSSLVGRLSRPQAIPSIAVLPFADMSAEKDQEYFCDGMADELINALSHIRELHVVARTSAFAFKGTPMDIRAIGKKLNVQAVLEGSIRKAGNTLRITAQLISVADGYHLWSERYDRDMTEIFAIQDEISAAIVDNLKVQLLAGERAALQRRATSDPDAYNLYLKGLYFVARPSVESYGKALDFFKATIEKDSSFAPAYAGMASVFVGLGVMNLAPPIEMWPRAKAAINKALLLDENLPEAHAAAASLAFWYEWDWDAAGRSFDRVLSIHPGDAMSHGTRGWFCLNRRRFDEAILETKRALELDPLMPLYYAWSVGLHWSVGMPDEALQEFAKAMEIDPNLGLAYFHAGVAYFLKGLLDDATAILEKGNRLFAPPGWIEAMLGLISLKKGDREEAVRILEETIEKRKTVRNVSAPSIAWLAGELGKLDLAFQLLDEAFDDRDVLMPFIHVYAKVFSPALCADPRFDAVLARMHLNMLQ